MRKRITISVERLRELLSYDQNSGAFTWRAPESNRVKVGSEAGLVAANGRRYVGIGGKLFMAHRLAWAISYGAWPEKNVVPVNGDYLDIRLANLKEETYGETARKGRVRGGGSSGVKGVSFDKSRGRWLAYITREYKHVSLGQFATKDEAVAARRGAEAQHNLVAISDEERIATREAVEKRALKRRLWHGVLRRSDGITGWSDSGAFIAEVGLPPAENHELAPVDASKPIGPGNFAWVLALRGGFDTSTREGRVGYNRAYRERNWLTYRGKDLKKKFGIDLATYQAMHDAQDGKCAICGEPETMKRGERQAWLAVDHNHKTGALRDLLCTACNRGIGVFNEDPIRLARAIAYLERHAVSSSTRT